MEFYVEKDGKAEGPLTLFRVVEWIRDGKLDKRTLGWHREMGEWAPLGEIQALAGEFERMEVDELGEAEGRQAGLRKMAGRGGPPPLPADGELEEDEDGTGRGDFFAREGSAMMLARPNPWLRAWARMLDLMPPTMIAMAVMVKWAQGRHIDQQQFLETTSLVVLGVFALWFVVETALVHRWGTTPGKYLCGIRVVSMVGESMGISWRQSIYRSVWLWVFGFGMQLPYLTLVALFFSLFQAVSGRLNLWERSSGTTLEYTPLSKQRVMLVIGYMVAWMMLFNVVVHLMGLDPMMFYPPGMEPKAPIPNTVVSML